MQAKHLARLVRMAPGYRSEEFLAWLAEVWFAGLWYLHKPKHKGNELTDALVLFGDTALLMEVKTREGSEMQAEATESWVRSKLSEATSQLERANESLGAGGVTLRNRYRALGVDWSRYTTKLGLVLLNVGGDSIPLPRVLPDRWNGVGLQLHVMTLYDFSMLLKLVNTPWDLVLYLEHRVPSENIPLHEESGSYARIVGLVADGLEARHDRLMANGYASFQNAIGRCVSRQGTAQDIRQVASSFLIDGAIPAAIRQAERDRHGNFIGHVDDYVAAAEPLAEMARYRRAFWGEKLLSCAEAALSDGGAHKTSGYSPSRETAYTWLATPVADDVREGAVADELRRALERHTEARRAICVAATPTNIFGTYEYLAGAFGVPVRIRDGYEPSLMDATIGLAVGFPDHGRLLPAR